MHVFKVSIRESEFAGHQITADVVRSDGRVVRSGMWPDYADIECALLNECVANAWAPEKYHAERKTRMAAARHDR